MAEESGRISVSEDKLYRALGDLELRLTKTIIEAVDKKADRTQVNSFEKRLNDLEDSRLARAHLEADLEKLKPRVDSLERESSDRAAVRRALRVAISTGILAFVSVVADLAVILGYLK